MKVYDLVPAVEVLIVAGFQMPVIPLVEVSGRAGAVLFWQTAPMALNTGVIWLLMVTDIVVVTAH